MIETAVYLDDILKILGWSPAKFFKWRQELITSGVIFYRKQGRPPRRRICAFPSRIQKWIHKKSQIGEDI